ncbi:MAG: DNA-processing protein DprA [Leptolyngbyaceae cyanobacterium MO_188.B28]|nr:DNA-processing protein DprA [Leptolyngbyaceae cyanobacterium MO_188.B28]
MEERSCWLAWSQIPGIGPVLLKRIHEHFGSLAIAWDANPESLLQVDGIGVRLSEVVREKRSQLHPARLLQQYESNNPNFWTPADAAYPRLLFEIPDPPPVLYYRGRYAQGNNQECAPVIGVVGTRSPSEYGKRWTRKLSRGLTQQGFAIVSGLAKGIDTEAHQSCLDQKGYTIAVLGTGVDIVYPQSNQALYEQIASQGLLLSEHANGVPPDRTHFPRRNRIIAGLSRAILVTEAPKRSGALITAHLANEYGRDVYALPGSLDNPRSLGCLELLNQGGQLILGSNFLMESLGAAPLLQSAKEESKPQPELEPSLNQVFQIIPQEPIFLDRIVEALNIETGVVLSALVQLELLGLVTQLPGMHYQRCD